MSVDSSKVRVALTGSVLVAPTSTAAPTAHGSALNAAFHDLGGISDAGVVEARGRSTNKIKQWQNADTAREVVTDADLTFHFTMLETNAETVALYYGVAIDTATGKVVVVPAATGGRKSFVIDVVDGSSIVRAYVRQGEITEVGDLTAVSGDAMGYEVTMRAYYNSTDAGAAIKWYSDLILP